MSAYAFRTACSADRSLPRTARRRHVRGAIPHLDGSLEDQPHRYLADVGVGRHAPVFCVPDRDPMLATSLIRWVAVATMPVQPAEKQTQKRTTNL